MASTEIRPGRGARALLCVFASMLMVTCGGGDSDCPLGTCDVAPASIEIVGGPLAFTALDETITLRATVRNQGGIDITSAATVQWSSSDPAFVTVSGASATARAVGSATIFASVGVHEDEVEATVTQVPAQLATDEADRTGTVGLLLSDPLVVTVQDANDHPIPDIPVAFTASEGTLSNELAQSDADGRATTTWTLGTVATVDQPAPTVAVSLPGRTAGPAAEFRATVLAGPPAALVKVAGDDESWLEGQETGSEVIARVIDGFGNGVSEQPVAFEPRNGGTSVPPTAMTELGGTATSEWFMGNWDQSQFDPQAQPDTIDVRLEGSTFPALVFTGTVYPRQTQQVFTGFKPELTPHSTSTTALHTCPDSNVVIVTPDGMEGRQARIISVAGEDCSNPRLFGRGDAGYPDEGQIRYEIPFFGLLRNTTWRFELLIRGVSFGERVGNNKICPESGCFEAHAVIDVSPGTVPANDDHATVFTLDGSGSYHSENDAIDSYAWTLPPGTTLLPGYEPADAVIQVTFPTLASYPVTLVVNVGQFDEGSRTVTIPIG